MKDACEGNFMYAVEVEYSNEDGALYEHRRTEIGLDAIEEIDLDHDAGDWAGCGGDYIKVIEYLEYRGAWIEPIKFRIHTMNPVGRENLKRAILKYAPRWTLEN